MLILANLENNEQKAKYQNKVINISYTDIQDIFKKLKDLQYNLKNKTKNDDLFKIIQESQKDFIDTDKNINEYIEIYETLSKERDIKSPSLQFQKTSY